MINNRDKIDELFREAMDGHRMEPSNGLWKNIESRFFTAGINWRKTALIVALLLAVTGAGVVTWFTLRKGEGPRAVVEEPKVPVDEYQGPAISGMVDAPVPVPEKQAEYRTVEPIRGGQETNQELPEQKTGDAETFTANTISAGLLPDTRIPSLDENPDFVTESSEAGHDHSILIASITALMIPEKSPVSSPLDLVITPSLPIYPGLENKYVRRSSFGVGAHITPSVIFYDPNPSKNGLEGELSVNYYHSSISIHTGIGVSMMQDIGYYDIHYTTYDSVGYYMNITGFTINPADPSDVDFIFKRETVYDSIPHASITEKTNRYTYLDIPLAVGFRFFEKNRISFTAKAGMKVSFLIGRYEPTVDFSMTGAEMISVDRMVPARMKTTWRFTAGLDVGYLLTDRLSLHIEPVYEQYLRTIYVDQPGFQPKKPFQVGIMTGLIYEF